MTGPLRPDPGSADVWRHVALSCLACGSKIDAAAEAGGGSEAPSDGDWAICFRCGEVMAYVVGPLGVGLREATGQELARFARSPYAGRVRDIHEFWVAHQQGRGER